jgi:hypothetical protein
MRDPRVDALAAEVAALHAELALVREGLSLFAETMQVAVAQGENNNKCIAALLGYRLPEDPGTYTIVQEPGHA